MFILIDISMYWMIGLQIVLSYNPFHVYGNLLELTTQYIPPTFQEAVQNNDNVIAPLAEALK